MKRLAISLARNVGHAAMAPLEGQLMRAKPDRALPPVFIIGAPRSGTSLLYELLITRFRFAYMANAAHRFYRTPLAATRLFQGAIGKWEGNFTSRYGHIDGWGAPNEGGWIWQRWLADGDWTDGRDYPEPSIAELRQLTAGFTAVLDAPFLNKNVMHSNRLRLMQRIWPDALYIEVRRDIRDNARSIIRAERSEGGPEKHGDIWWSVRPRLAADYAGKSDSERAVAQVIGVARDIAEDMAIIDQGRLFSIDYADMCAAPAKALGEMEQFLAAHGYSLQQRLEVPEHFPVRPSKPLSDADEAVLTQTIEALAQ
ncbi:MAG: sulfotransferase [Pseudomonadota bacterium]